MRKLKETILLKYAGGRIVAMLETDLLIILDYFDFSYYLQ
jgi:hypothetical protein